MPKDNNYTVTFPSIQTKDMAYRGLLDLRSLFEMRFNEANTAGATSAAFEATEDLVNVMAALDAFSE